MSAPRRLLTIGHSYCVRRNRELAETIAREGRGEWEVTVAAPDRYPGDLAPIVTTHDADERCDLRRLPVRFASRVHVMTYGGMRRLLGERWDVVHCWEEPYVLAAAQVAHAAGPGPALVYASFQNIDKRYPPPFGAIERYSMRRARGWIAFGASIEATLGPRPAYAARPHAVIPFGVDLARFTPDSAGRGAVRARSGWDVDGPPVVGYLGPFVESKGLPMLVEVLEALERRGVAWRALFVGGGPWEGRLREFAARHEGRVQVATGVSHDDVPPYLHAMDVLAAPSQTTPSWREQFGRMIVEAFACAVPVVGSDSGEIPHVIGDAGVIVGERDRDGWVRALERLLGDAALRREVGARGRARAEREFDWSVVARRHLAFFHQLLAS
ncbi:MAG TPA: glycosyltransferase family 4 protein [Gemmatimonadaceae bacterium]